MCYIEYNGLNEDFFEFQYDLDAELKNDWGKPTCILWRKWKSIRTD
jgi:hypothetical protein